jgi:subtilase family serine protease
MYQYFRIHPAVGVARATGHDGAAGVTNPTPIGGYAPGDIRSYYGFDQIMFTDAQGHQVPGDGRGETIAVVDAYDTPNVASDLHVFDQQYGLPDPPSFRKINQTGGNAYPWQDDGWAMEIALDVEWAHAMAPQANILVVESTTNNDSDMWAAVDYARQQPGVVAVSMSRGEPEYAGQSAVDAHLATPSGHGGVTFLAASGDDGGQPLISSTSPNAVGAGGPSLMTGSGFAYESAWSASSGGISAYNAQPSYQKGVVSPWSTTRRTGPDMAYNADPWYGFAVHESDDGSGYRPNWSCSPPTRPCWGRSTSARGSSASDDSSGWPGPRRWS